MDIFETGHTRLRRTLRNILPVIIPAVLCLIFYLGISCAGRETISREQSSLQQALEQSAIQAYALTGHYPLSLEELLHDIPLPPTYLSNFTSMTVRRAFSQTL